MTESNESFQYALNQVKVEYTDLLKEEPEAVNKIINKLTNTFNNPPVNEIEFIIHKTFSVDEIRVVLFRPLDDHISYYPLLLTTLESLPLKELQSLKPLVLSLIYLVHRRNTSFVKEFILSDGIGCLASMVNDKNLFYRGQILEILLTMTDCDSYDWFKPAVSYADKLLHSKLLKLVDHPTFLFNLISNRTGSYPGGSFRALQLLAFWLSWVRALYTSNHILSLSDKIITELSLWSQEEHENDNQNDSHKSEEEIKLAKTLLDDFGHQQFLSNHNEDRGDMSAPQTEKHYFDNNQTINQDIDPASMFVTGAVIPKIEDIPINAVEIINTNDNSNSSDDNSNSSALNDSALNSSNLDDISYIDQITSLKNEGNDYYKSNDYIKALEIYQKGIDLIKNSTDISSHLIDNSIIISLYLNCAMSHWKLLLSSRESFFHFNSSINSNNEIEILQEYYNNYYNYLSCCMNECEIVLKMQPTNIKAIYRFCYCMLLKNKPRDAIEYVNNAIASLTVFKYSTDDTNFDRENNINNMNDNSINDISFLKQIRSKCYASLYVNIKNHDLIPYNILKVMDDMMKRNQSVLSTIGENEYQNNFSCYETFEQWLSLLKNKKIEQVIMDLNNMKISENNNNNNNKLTSNSKTIKTKNKIEIKDIEDNNNIKSNKKKKEKSNTKLLLLFTNQLKTLGIRFEKYLNNNSFSNDNNGNILNDTADCLVEMWSHNLSLEQVFIGCSFEEYHLLLLVETSYFLFIRTNDRINDRDNAMQVLKQLSNLSRFSTVLILSLCNNDPLKTKLKEMISNYSQDNNNEIWNKSYLKYLSN
eukprot:gene6445-8866_t